MQNTNEPPRAIAIDFDGTICSNEFPNIGVPNWPVIQAAKREQEAGAELILWTNREGELLQDAIDACEDWGLMFEAVNASTDSWKCFYGNDPRKIGATEYWDDKAVAVRNGRLLSVETEAYSTGYDNGYAAALRELNAPMPVITRRWDPSECPRCHRTYGDYEPCDDGYYDRATGMERCPYCGQKLKWY